ncbi:Inositol-1-monophosphatase [Streptomyces sp. YIM 121038]|uniref:inositol monophosphatase family protein n=1 Tax=Streptomyces sp. YIM 121038 TaxID=2136401 RepID=UPI001110F9AD|nr:inositol monophosphatase family protein [Streptomyces sp. YIM 121038]QCX80778.1 Inositol-1-monophosphatase [Streptomyces sp. YIM 121038]
MSLAHAEGGAALLELAVRAARTAGDLLLEGAASGPPEVRTKSSATDLVTAFDRASEERVVEVLTAARPDDGILGEEGGERPGRSGVRWVIDPLDGTANFVSGYPAFVVSVAAERDGRTEVGVVHDPSRRETFTAVRGRGAARDGRALTVSGPDRLEQALVSTGFSSDPAARARQAALAAQVVRHVRDIRSSGSAALDLCWVAAGRLGAYYESGTRLWDRAAGVLIAEEAGAWVGGGAAGEPPGDAMTIASAPKVAHALRALVGHA